MGMFTKKINNLEELFWEQVKDLYDAEKRLVKALPKMAEGASQPELKAAIQDHERETQEHVRRLEQVFKMRNKNAEAETCEAMKGLLEEGEEMLALDAAPEVKDAAIIAAAQRVEHYEIAGYGTVRTFAQQLGFNDAVSIFQKTLDEEGRADKLLTQIATGGVNQQATQTGSRASEMGAPGMA